VTGDDATVLVVDHLRPELAGVLPKLRGLIAETGSPLSHLAILARELGIATVVGYPNARADFDAGDAVIVDGNRRWAEEVGLSELADGHRHGADKVDELLDWCGELGVAEVTIWALSGENLSRSGHELDALLDADAYRALTEA